MRECVFKCWEKLKLRMMIKRASERDFEGIRELNTRLVQHVSRHDQLLKLADEGYARWLHKRLSDGNSLFVVAREKNVVMGYLLSWIEYRPYMKELIGYVCEGFVDEERRRQGVCTQMLNEAMVWFREKGIKVVEVDVHQDNEDAVAILQSLGFSEMSRRMRLEI